MACQPDAGCKPDSTHRETRWEDATHCTDSTHPHFWMPANWPGGRAPARVEYHAGWSGWSVSLWVLDAGGEAELWWGGNFGARWDFVKGHRSLEEQIVRVIRGAEEDARQLEADRDAYYTDRAELEEVQLAAMGMPG